MGNRHIKDSVRHELYARSGNLCEFPGCTHSLFENDDTETTNIGEICHIEGLNPNSARYNPKSSDRERNSIKNLILLCANHHSIVDQDETLYTVEKLKQMKAEHESHVEQMLKNSNQAVFQKELQTIFQECRFDKILLEQSFDAPFPDWYIDKLEEGYLRIRALLNLPCSLCLSAKKRKDLYAFTQLSEYVLSGVTMNCFSNGNGVAIPRYNTLDLEATSENLKSLQKMYQKYRF